MKERAETIINQWRQKAELYNNGEKFNEQNVLVPLGDDFRYIRPEEFNSQYTNFENLMEFINNKPEYKVTVKFSTLSEYFNALKPKMEFPALSGDFFTYADREQDYWSGYFTTRPYYKNLERVLANKIYTASFLKMMQIINTNADIDSLIDYDDDFKSLSEARAELGVFQHHDGITGTARSNVVLDYGERLNSAEAKSQTVMENVLSKIYQREIKFQDYRHDVSVKNPINLDLHASTLVVLVNQNSKLNDNTASIYFTCMNIYTCEVEISQADSNGNMQEIPGQIEALDDTSNTYRLVFRPLENSISGLSYSTFLVKKVETPNLTEKAILISQHESLEIKSGLLYLKKFNLQLDMVVYKSDVKRREREGAYLFLPDGHAVEFGEIITPSSTKIYNGPIRTIITIAKAQNAHFDIILDKNCESSFELEARTNLNDYNNNMNVAIRLQTLTPFNNDGTTTDMNGLSFNKRDRLDFNKVPIQGQFYPMSAAAYLENLSAGAASDFKFLGVTTQQPLAAASLIPGQFDIILDRRLNQDDNRGLGQPIKDNRFSVLRFNVHVAKANPAQVDPPEEEKFQTLLFESSFRILRPLSKFISYETMEFGVGKSTFLIIRNK